MIMDANESSPSLEDSEINDLIAVEESLDLSKKRKFQADESDLLPLPKHFCLEHASVSALSCPSSDMESGMTVGFSGDFDESAECSYAMEERKSGSDETSSTSGNGGLYMFKDSSCYSTGNSSSSKKQIGCSSSIDQDCSKIQEGKDFTHLEFICSEFAIEDLEEFHQTEIEEVLHSQDMNQGSNYILSSARWSISSNQDSVEATTKPTIDQEFEQYFSTLMM